jgi:hypothetical protein
MTQVASTPIIFGLQTTLFEDRRKERWSATSFSMD